MRQFTRRGFLAGVLLATGCNNWPHRRDDVTRTDVTPPPAGMKAEDLVAYLNANSSKMQAVVSKEVWMDAKENGQSVGLNAQFACQKPRSLRLVAKAVGGTEADIGSNETEFWYWIKRSPQPYVFHCAYRDLADPNLRVQLPFPLDPDMVVAALGMGDYPTDPAKYRLERVGPNWELSQDAPSPDGRKTYRRVTVFAAERQLPPKPQVVAHVLKDDQGKEIYRATVLAVQADARGVVPSKVKLAWPAQRMEMTMTLNAGGPVDVRTTGIEPATAANLFSRNSLSSIRSIDLARNQFDGGQPSANGITRVRGSSLR
jgi:hypothetical protein